MSFESPAALWALLSLLLLVLFSLWRQGASRATVPSLALWKKIPERNPPIRALRRPRWRLELLLQALAIAAAVAALAGPYRETREFQPRRVALVFDTSARMRAGDRLVRAHKTAGELPLQGDDVKVYVAQPAPQLVKVFSPVPVDVHVDLEPLLAAARASSDHVILFSDRPAAGAKLSLLAAPADNIGIVDFAATNDEVFVRLVNHGPAKPIPIELVAGATKVRETVPAGQTVWFRRGDYSKAESVRVTLDVADSFMLDNLVEATRMGDLATTVSVTGLIHPQLVKALKSVSGVTVRTGGPAAVAIGVDAPPGPAPLRVWIHSATPLKGEAKVTTHALTADLDKRTKELGQVLGALPSAAGTPLITVDGKVAAALQGQELRIAVDLHAWGQSLASLPIFCANVVEVARAGASGFAILRTGQPLLNGSFVTHTVGDYVVETPAGPKTIRANLLDERESDTAGQNRPLDWDPGTPAGRVARRQGFAGWAAGGALVLLLLAWFMQLRTE
jgi:hypothetical protein